MEPRSSLLVRMATVKGDMSSTGRASTNSATTPTSKPEVQSQTIASTQILNQIVDAVVDEESVVDGGVELATRRDSESTRV